MTFELHFEVLPVECFPCKVTAAGNSRKRAGNEYTSDTGRVSSEAGISEIKLHSNGNTRV